MAPEGLPDPLAVALAAAAIFDRLGIPYVTVGSFARSLHGEPRSTDDIDFVADLRAPHVASLVNALRGDWYVSDAAVDEAIRRGSSFNAIHLASGVKVDVFVVGADPFDAHRIASARSVDVSSGGGGGGAAVLRMDTAEYTVLRKLEWFRRGGEMSDRQWRDVVGILRTQGPRLDRAELARWADGLGVADLLARALVQAGG
jgi:hypothetical protein